MKSSSLLETLMSLKAKINKLIYKQAIEQCIDCENQFLSSYFLVFKPGESNRLIINLRV